MPVQDDVRERQMLDLFNLVVPPERRRHDTDAYLRMNDQEFPFELKSSTGGSVSTVRDFGPDHIAKWKGKHWLFGFYDVPGTTLQYCLYGSPAAMEPWISEKELYIWPDLVLADSVPAIAVSEALVHTILGEKDVYSMADARLIHKAQWSAAEYRDNQDIEGGGYSLGKMVEILRLRCEYVIRRGATLNNPHISAAYFAGWEQITQDHASTLRRMVREYLDHL